MKIAQVKEFNGITEFKNNKKSGDIKIYLYTLPVRDINSQHTENYAVTKELKRLNNCNHKIVFNEYMIGSFEEIVNWGDIKYKSLGFRAIDISIATEKGILERLLLEDIKSSIDTSIYELKKNKSIYIKKPLCSEKNLIIKRKIDFDINIEDDGNIIIGFALAHGFDYYNNKGESYIVSNLDPKTKAVLVETYKGQVFPYIASRLKKVCEFRNLSENKIKECNKYIKLKSHDRMKLSIDITVDILRNCEYVKFDKRNMLAKNLGYEKYTLRKPTFIFGNNGVHSTISHGLNKSGSYQRKNIEISYFIDPNIIKDKNKFEKIRTFIKELEKFSANIGVTIKRVSTNIDFKYLDMANKDLFELELRNIVENYKNPAIVIMEDLNCSKYYNLIKKIFGNRNNIATQFIELSTVIYDGEGKNSILLNILLGVYGKSGVQPWILQEPLQADCFIGIDVSRENKLNTAGIVQIIGKDGRVLSSKSMTSPQAGEKIRIETIKEMLYEVNSSYKKIYGQSPKHVVFHRDGISREELDLLKETASNLNIEFDYVEITKNVQRRIANMDSVGRTWETEIGSYYVKDNKAYIVTTNPYYKLGMAQPIRVSRVYGNQSIQSIVSDVYKLSFMHIGSILKSRLPVTTHYADLSSTYGNRELIHNNIDSNSLHFI